MTAGGLAAIAIVLSDARLHVALALLALLAYIAGTRPEPPPLPR